MLQKQHRLTSRRDFKTAFAGGRTYVHKLLVMKVLPTSGERPSRFAFSASAAMGNAAIRNRARRLLRESVRLLGSQLKQRGYDVVLIARPPVCDVGLAEVDQAVRELSRKAGLLNH